MMLHCSEICFKNYVLFSDSCSMIWPLYISKKCWYVKLCRSGIVFPFLTFTCVFCVVFFFINEVSWHICEMIWIVLHGLSIIMLKWKWDESLWCYCVGSSKKSSPSRRESSSSSRKLTQGKISDYVKPQSKSVSRSSSRRMSEESTSSSKNSPTTSKSQSERHRRARDSSDESSDRRPSSSQKNRQSSISSVSRSSSSPAKKSTAVNRLTGCILQTDLLLWCLIHSVLCFYTWVKQMQSPMTFRNCCHLSPFVFLLHICLMTAQA